ncbi:hypothetical protein MTBBW1_1770004 [Desulfamplus magnetovallimortis]|uniref:Uncharacterized protein n=1 Tax=Desulfamplus magnetovallimortis TaxID=1246637 RepID=A0A1W1HA79_9BACT|nr:hypothetical protein MTBBW1_1770004 [Desulfamplus magnetovallimortis]
MPITNIAEKIDQYKIAFLLNLLIYCLAILKNYLQGMITVLD